MPFSMCRFRQAMTAMTLGVLTADCSEAPRSAAADVPITDVRRLPPGRTAQIPDVMMQAADAGRAIGPDSAPVRVYVVSDYQCPDCRAWFEQTLPALRAAYVETGKVRLTWTHYPLRAHTYAVRAASASLCASVQGKFWEASAALFTSQDQWGGSRDGTFLVDSVARVPGTDAFTFQNCVDSGRMLRQVRMDIDWADTARVGAPLTVLVGSRRVVGPPTLASVRAAIDAALAERSR
jgi:hypothetical protein